MADQDQRSPTERRGPFGGKLRFGDKQFGQLLIEAGVIDGDALSRALDRQRSNGEKLGEALVNMSLATEADIADALARQLDLEVFNPSEATGADPEVVLMIPEYIARQRHALAIDRNGDVLTVAVADPLDIMGRDDIRMATGLELHLKVGTRSDIDRAIAVAYRAATADQHIEEAMEGARLELGAPDIAGVDEITEQELRSRAEDAPIVRLVNLILGQAIAEGATDIHIERLEDRIVVRYRVDGVLYDTVTPPEAFHDAIVVRIKILSDMDVAERRIPLDGRFTVKFENREVDVRVSTLPTIHGEKVAMRLLDKSVFTTQLEHLGFESEMLEAFRASLKRPYGMVLISGPTGSGKSTTLYAGMRELDRISKNITTLEDPVEYHLDRINQVSINRKAGMTFAGGLRSILRQDPDIIMVGEIRDLETAELAVRSALTGHLVFSTVHANDAASTATRLVDIGIVPYLVTSAVNLVMAQRLVRKICQDCKAPYDPDPAAVKAFGEGAFDGITFYRGTGCKQCKGRGYRGRTGVFELVEMVPQIAELVMRGASADTIRDRALELGYPTLRHNAVKKVRQGITTVEEALGICAELL